MISAEFLDIFGLIGFIMLFLIGLKIAGQKKLKYYGYITLLVSFIGIIADSYSIITNFIIP
ncbi:MAG: hypothetical protein PHH00_00905 [Candidatus Nanoarchaeia archaeon]|nr:hypothetical protein [Candidatus Nanoarchaeia archaeon]